MIPKSLSATSMQVAQLCMKRWRAQYMTRTSGFSNFAANTGTAVHGGLEEFVRLVYINKTHEASEKLLIDLYTIAYIKTFGSADTGTDEFKDGVKLCKTWYKRNSPLGVERVESVEVKETIEIPVLINGVKEIIPFNYVMDRVDYLGNGVYRVVDYKTVRMPVQPDDLRGKIQARAYGLAIQIKYPDAKQIKVVFDLLRYDEVGIVLKREDNIDTWKFLKTEAQRIVDTDDSQVRPTLNMECGFCPVKATCPALMSNLNGGGIHSLSDDKLVELKAKVEAQIKGAKQLLDELEDKLLAVAYERDELDWESADGSMEVSIKSRKTRQVDASQVAAIIGDERFSKLGSITLGTFDELRKDESLSLEQRQALDNLVTFKMSDPRVQIKQKSGLF